MKTRLFLIPITLLIALTLTINSFAQFSQQMRLPKGADAPIGGIDIKDIKYSPNGERLAVACNFGILIYDTQNYDKPELIREPTGRAWTLAYSPTEKTLASTSRYGKIFLIHEITGLHLRTLDGNANYIAGMTFSPDGNTIASYGVDGDIRLLDVKNNEPLLTLKGHILQVRCVAYSPDGKTIASGGKDRTLRLWDAKTGRQRRKLTEHVTFVNAIAFSPDGKMFASGGHNLCLWDAETARLIRSSIGHHWIQSVAFSPDGKTLGVHTGLEFFLWDVKDGHIRSLEKRSIPNSPARLVTGPAHVVFSPDGSTIATQVSNEVKLWDAETGELLRKLTSRY